MKINDYPEIQNLGESDKMLVETENGTSIIKTKNMVLPTGFSSDNAIVHKTNIRGKNLGDTYTLQQKQAIADGSFDDLYLGDYWEKDGIKWQIVDINYWEDKPNHLVIMPTKPVGNSIYDDRQNTVPKWSGYKTSKLRTEYVPSLANSKIVDLFNTLDNIMPQTLFLCVSVDTDGAGSIFLEWNNDCKIEIPKASQIVGYSAPSVLIEHNSQNLSQFSYFNMCSNFANFLGTDKDFWLQDIVSSTRVSYITKGVVCGTGSITSSTKGVRPYFCLY